MLAFWFKGIHELIDIYSSESNIRAILLILLPLLLFVSDDGSLSELHNIDTEQKNIVSKYAAGMMVN